MQKTESIWYNGKLVPWDEAKIHVLTHGLHYGSGAFEGIRFYETSKGPAIFKLKEHVARLIFSASVLRMALPYTEEQITAAIIEVVRSNKVKEGYIRPILYYGYGKMGVNPTGCPVDLAIACWPWGAYLPHDAVDIKTSHYIRIHPDSTEVSAKLCGHYINSLLASVDLQGTHYHEALLLDSAGYISEGVGENFFMMKEGILYTPKLGTILPGITRATVIQLAKDWGLEVIEQDLLLTEAYAADEAFFTGTAVEITPIRSIDDKLIGKEQPGVISTKVKLAYSDIVRGKNPAYQKNLTYID